MHSIFRPQTLIAVGLLILTIATRGSHVGSAALLPDATLAAMLLGGMLLKRGAWFGGLLTACVAVDAFAVGIAGVSSYCLSPAYWALLPTYAVMWLGGLWLAKRKNAFETMPYIAVALAVTSSAFVISTHSFYLFSGKFPQASLWEVLQHGWEYYPAYLGYTMMYLAAAWATHHVLRILSATRQSRAA
jgi:hypothetical protein